jgi:glycosyltransferase involved in cell wall biosynthesis
MHIVNYELGLNNGILSKYANKMAEILGCSVSNKPEGEINHHINYLPYVPNGKKNTLMITHIWEGYKLDKVKEGMKTADYGICFSDETKNFLISHGVPKKKLVTILPAHDSLPKKTIKVAITTNVYPDGCKREWMFEELLKNIDKERFHFFIMGSGWKLPNANISYLDHFDPNEYIKILHLCDYHLYFGKDEGAMGTLDAKHVGLPTIAPEIGFVKGLIDYPFDTQEELNKIFKDFSKVDDWTWINYCKQHEKIWEKLR